jgi:hypothetical protein
MKKALGLIVASLLLSAPAMAEEVPQIVPYNCDYAPSCEVAPGIYGAMSSPVISKFKVSIGGYVKFDYANNSEDMMGGIGPISPDGFLGVPSRGSNFSQLVNGAASFHDQSQFGVNQSRLWVKVDGPKFLGAKTGALVEGDFYGGIDYTKIVPESPLFRVRHAYGTLDWANTQVLFGQFWDLFGAMIPNTQDFRYGAPYGAPGTPRAPQIRLTQKVNLDDNNQLKFILGVQDPQQTGDQLGLASTNLSTINVNGTPLSGNPPGIGNGYGGMPDFAVQAYYINKALGSAPGFYGLSMSPLMVGAFGMYGQDKYDAAGGHTLPTWGAGLYTFVPVLKSPDGKSRAMTMSFEGQVYEAANMTFNNATELDFLGPTPGNQERVAKNFGFASQVIFWPIQDLGLTAGYGMRKVINNQDYVNSAGMSDYQLENQEIYVNATYDLNAAIRLATEWQNLKTVWGNANGVANSGVIGNDNTIRLCAYYFF